jgi:hypothetical protein
MIRRRRETHRRGSLLKSILPVRDQDPSCLQGTRDLCDGSYRPYMYMYRVNAKKYGVKMGGRERTMSQFG